MSWSTATRSSPRLAGQRVCVVEGRTTLQQVEAALFDAVDRTSALPWMWVWHGPLAWDVEDLRRPGAAPVDRVPPTRCCVARPRARGPVRVRWGMERSRREHLGVQRRPPDPRLSTLHVELDAGAEPGGRFDADGLGVTDQGRGALRAAPRSRRPQAAVDRPLGRPAIRPSTASTIFSGLSVGILRPQVGSTRRAGTAVP